MTSSLTVPLSAQGIETDAEVFANLGWCRRACYEIAYVLSKLAMRVFAIGYA